MPANLYAVVYKTGPETHPGYRVRVHPSDRKRIMWVSDGEVAGMRVISSVDQLSHVPLDEHVAVPKELAERGLGW